MCLYSSFIENSHTIISGSTGSGKSVLINNFLYHLISDVEPWKYELWIIDPKRVDYIEYKPICREYSVDIISARKTLEKAVQEMFRRYNYLEYNRIKQWKGSHIFLLIDEFGQILRDKECVNLLDELLRLGRAARIHVIAANQSASRMTGCPAHMRVNFTCEIALHCVDKTASRQAMGFPGAELLPLYGYCCLKTPKLLKPELYKITPILESEIQKAIYNRPHS